MNRAVFLTLLGVSGLALAGTPALAGSGVGGIFNLGRVNSVNAITQLQGATSTQLYVVNTSTAVGSAIRGSATATTGTHYGVFGTTSSLNGLAGFFRNTNPSTTTPTRGAGVPGFAAGAQTNMFTGLTYAAGGEFAGPNGVVGISSEANQGTGVAGISGEGDYGVYGVASSANALAGFFQNRGSGNGVGIRALGPGAIGNEIPAGWDPGAGEFIGGSGVIGVATGSGGPGVLAARKRGSAGYSLVVIGRSDLAGDVDIVGALDAHHADFSGNVAITGTLTKPAGSFKIDHPLDPENKYLFHSFVESPDMMNIYNGNVVTDSEGTAIVALPDYFEALNRDPRYQLTVIGSPATAYISQKVSDNRFSIQTSAPGVEVSWQVTGIRQDAYARQHPIVVEKEKAVADRGHYLHPEAFGKPASLAIGRKVPQIASVAE